MENDPNSNKPEETPPPEPQGANGDNTPQSSSPTGGSAGYGYPPDGATSVFTQMSPAVAEKVASATLRSLGNRSSGLLLLTQLLAGAVMFVIIIARTVLSLRGSAGNPTEITKALSLTGGTMILYTYIATFWGMVLCLVIARSMLRQRVFDWWRKPRTPLSFLAESVVLMFGAVCVGEILSAAVTYLFSRFGISNGTPNFELKGDRTTDAVLIVYVCILAPILEETLFRGMILQSLRPWGDRFAVVVSALLFGVFHMNLVQGVAAFCMGLVLGLIAVRSGSVLPGIFVHFLNNTLSMVLMTAGVNTNSVLQQGYLGILVVCLLGSAALMYYRRADFAISNMQQTQAPPARHRYRTFLLQSAWFWVLIAMFALTCVLLALSPQSALLQKVS